MFLFRTTFDLIKKILVIRLSSMGDVVLTTPIVRCLKTQVNADIHFLIKPQFVPIIEHSPHIKHIHIFSKGSDELIKNLHDENFDMIIDLQKNSKSIRIRKKLNPKEYYSFSKLNLRKWLYVQSGINILPKKHLVDRYFEGLRNIGLESDGKGCEIFVPESIENQIQEKFNLPETFGVLAIGAAHSGKRLQNDQLNSLLSNSKNNLILLGDQNDLDKTKGLKVNSDIINLCGKTSILEIVSIIKRSSFCISGDTGIMHIASCFAIPQISIWGCTTPILGMYPYLQNNHEMVRKHSNRPCSKLGNKCRNYPEYCISEIDAKSVTDALESLFLEK